MLVGTELLLVDETLERKELEGAMDELESAVDELARELETIDALLAPAQFPPAVHACCQWAPVPGA